MPRLRLRPYALLSAFALLVLGALFLRESRRAGSPLVVPSGYEGSGQLPHFPLGRDGLDGEQHKLCILVPYRWRFEELLQFVPHMDSFLRAQGVSDYSVYVVDQVDALRFNRASLLNAGFLFSQSHDPRCDYVALHDVDLLPRNPALSYSFPSSGPRHLSPAGLHPKYDYENFLGGILLMRADQFRAVDGMSNLFWGWGQEDDEFVRRLWDAGLSVSTPLGVDTGPEDTFRHVHSPRKRPRDYQKCYNQRDVTRRRDRRTGLSTLKYKVVGDGPRRLFVDGGGPVFVLQVELDCDRTETPYCDCSDAPATESPLQPMDPNDNIMPRMVKKNKKRKG